MFLERDIRMAGANMDGVSYPSPDTTSNELLYPIANDNDNAAGDAGSDSLTIVYIDYYAGTCGAVPAAAPAGAIICDDLPLMTLKGTMSPTSTEGEVEEDFSASPHSLWDGECYCNDVLFGVPPSSAGRYRAIIKSPDGEQSDIIWVTQVQQVGTEDKIGNGPYDGYDNKVANLYPAGSTIGFFGENSYVDVTYDLVNGNLRRNGAAIAANIEDLQFAFGLDTNDDGSVDSWINSADLNDTQKLQVRMVRINILGRSSKEIFGTNTSIRPQIEDHAASATTDRYKRRRLALTVKVRNLGI
jgi:hypothetical protein